MAAVMHMNILIRFFVDLVQKQLLLAFKEPPGRPPLYLWVSLADSIPHCVHCLWKQAFY